MKLSGIIVAYFPNLDDLRVNVRSCIDDLDVLIIWRNSAITFEEEIIREYKGKVFFLGSGDNIGIASALNEGVRWSIANGYSHILTLDQDSHFERGHLAKYKSLITGLNRTDVGVYGVNPCNKSLLYTSSSPFIEVSDTITSGSIYPLDVFLKFGFFEDELFIDAVDYEYCYRLKAKAGLVTLVFPNIVLQHKVGYVTKTWLGFKTDNYSAFRTYYIVRNQIIIWRRYPFLFPSRYKLVVIKTHIIGRLIKVLLGEQYKYRKIRSILIGMLHGLQGRKGFFK